MRAKWQGQRDLLKRIQENKDRIEQLKIEAQQAERQGDYGKVAEIRYGKIQEAEKEIAAFQEEYKLASANGSMIKEEVDAQDVAEVVSRWTGIPVTRMLASEREKLLHMEDELHRRVIGQEQAIAAISDAVRRSRAGLNDPRKPIGSFIFLGTTGVGKTELAKALAEFLFNDDSMMTRIDMSEYQERHSVSRLVERLRDTSVTTRAASSPKPCAASPIRSCCSTRSRKRTPTSSTFSCRCSTTAV